MKRNFSVHSCRIENTFLRKNKIETDLSNEKLWIPINAYPLSGRLTDAQKSDENDPFEFRKQLIFGVFVALSQRSVVKFGGFEVRFVSFCFYCILPSGQIFESSIETKQTNPDTCIQPKRK